MEEPALAELPRLSVDVDADPSLVDEVQLVLRVVIVLGSLVTRRIDDRVDAERIHAEGLPDLAKARALAELVERAERVGHPEQASAVCASGSRPSNSASCSRSCGENREPNSSSMSARCDSRASSIFFTPDFVSTAYVTRASESQRSLATSPQDSSPSSRRVIPDAVSRTERARSIRRSRRPSA